MNVASLLNYDRGDFPASAAASSSTFTSAPLSHQHHRSHHYHHHSLHLSSATTLPRLRDISSHSSRHASSESSLSRSPSSSLPSLDRSDSYDSQTATASSPLTPTYNSFDSAHHARAAKLQLPLHPILPQIQSARSCSSSSSSSYLPPMAHSASDHSYPATPQSSTSDFAFSAQHSHPFYRQQQMAQPQNSYGQQLPAQPQQVVFSNNMPNTSKSTKKNSYPCPVSKQYNCLEFFTTSGHAARHAKKHTGKKDAICPECGKAFTRKDNMEQHRRTHSGARASSNSSTSDRPKTTPKLEDPEEARIRRARQQQRKARPASISTATSSGPASAATDLTMLDPALRGSPTMFSVPEETPSPHGSAQQALLPATAVMQQQQQRSPLPRSGQPQNVEHRLASTLPSASTPRYPSPPVATLSPSHAPALDALALAAESESRQSDDP